MLILLRKFFLGHLSAAASPGVDTAACLFVTLIITFLTKPTDMDILVRFYARIRPFGLWGPVRREAVRRGLVPARDKMPAIDAANGLADWLDSPPAMLAHLPPGLWGDGRTGRKKKDSFSATREEIEFLSVEPAEAVRLSACRASSDGKALLIRLVESAGTPKEVRVKLLLPAVEIPLAFKPFEIITLSPSIHKFGNVFIYSGLSAE